MSNSTERLSDAGRKSESRGSDLSKSDRLSNLQSKTAAHLDTTNTAIIMLLDGKSVAQIRQEGFGLKELKTKCGSSDLLKYSDLRDGGYTVSDFREAGMSYVEIKKAGFAASEIKDYVASHPGELRVISCSQSSGGYTPSELKSIGFDDPKALKLEGFLAGDLKSAFSATELRCNGRGYNGKEMKAGAFQFFISFFEIKIIFLFF